MNINENKDNVKIKTNTNIVVNNTYLHKPTGYTVIVDLVLDKLILCSVISNQTKIATLCIKTEEAFKNSEYIFTGNMKFNINQPKPPIKYWINNIQTKKR